MQQVQGEDCGSSLGLLAALSLGSKSAQVPRNGGQRTGVGGSDGRVVGGAGSTVLAEKGRRERAATHRGKCPKRHFIACLFRMKET